MTRIRSILPRGHNWPVVVLLLTAVIVAIALQAAGRMTCEEVFDTASYLGFPLLPLEAGLVSIRTYGYPLFLQTVLGLTGSKAAVPWAQYAMHLLCVLCWYWGARAWFPSAWLAASAAGSLLVTNTLLRNVFIISSDGLASSFAIATIGALMATVAQPRRLVGWLLLGPLIFATYQIRPAYLFLVGLCPLLGVGLLALRQWLCVDGDHAGQALGRWPTGGLLAGIALGPLLVFCLVRWALVGDFGLVSFSGYNFCGVVGQFLDRPTISCLPAEVQPVAAEALRRREALAKEKSNFSGEVVTNYMMIENRFNDSTWTVFYPAADTIAGGDPVQTNRLLVRLAASVIRCRPTLYVIWLAKAWARGVYILASELVIHPLALVLLPLLPVIHFVTISRRRDAVGLCPRDMLLPLNALLLIAVVFSFVNLAFIIVSSPPLSRFMDAAGVFWLPWFCLVFASRWQLMRSAHRSDAETGR